MSNLDKENDKPDLSKFKSDLSFRNKLLRLVWGCCWALLFRTSPRIAFGWRRILLRCFGAKIGKNVRVYNSTSVYYPPNLNLGDNVVVGPDVDLYCVARIVLEANSMVSQYAYLCAATHDYRFAELPLVAKPIVIGEGAWICARAFVGPGVTIGQHTIVGACAAVFKTIGENQIVGGNPAAFIKMRYPNSETANVTAQKELKNDL